MDSLKESLENVSAQRVPVMGNTMLRARDIMSRRVLTLRKDEPLVTAVMKLVARKVSGAPVVDTEGKLVGILSEFDCMKILADGSFHQEGVPRTLKVEDLMSTSLYSVDEDSDLFAIASLFISKRIRRLPVMSSGKLVGLVSRRDALSAISQLYR